MAVYMSVTTTSVSQVTGVENLTRFEIMHIKYIGIFWNQWELYGNPMRRV